MSNNRNRNRNVQLLDNSDTGCTDRDFLKEVYNQCNTIYLSFVNFRFQVLALFVSNAALFVFVFDRRMSIKIDLMVSFIAVFFTWCIYSIDNRNRHIFKRVIEKARQIEIYFNVPENMRIHSKSQHDLKHKISHSLIFIVVSIAITTFWVFFLAFCIWRYN